MNRNIHVMPYRGGWDVTHEGARYAESHHATREEAIAVATALARREKVEVVVHACDEPEPPCLALCAAM